MRITVLLRLRFALGHKAQHVFILAASAPACCAVSCSLGVYIGANDLINAARAVDTRSSQFPTSRQAYRLRTSAVPRRSRIS